MRYLETPNGERPRVVVPTDPELDDLNSLIRFLLYSSDFRVEGLIYAQSANKRQNALIDRFNLAY